MSPKPLRPTAFGIRLDALRELTCLAHTLPGVTLRLTRRGVAVLAVAIAGLAAVLVWLAARSAPSPAPAPRTVPANVTVRTGDTLWSIADRVAPQRDLRAEVATLQRLNHLSGATLVPGQVLRTR